MLPFNGKGAESIFFRKLHRAANPSSPCFSPKFGKRILLGGGWGKNF